MARLSGAGAELQMPARVRALSMEPDRNRNGGLGEGSRRGSGDAQGVMFRLLLLATLGAAAALSQVPSSPIRFAHRQIDFTLENSETSQRHAPETMAGGLGLFDFDNDGDLDLFFANGAEIATLRKSDPKFFNRLLANDGAGSFTDVTFKAGLQGAGFDTGVATGDYDNDGHKDLFVTGVHRNTLYRNNGDGTFTDVTARAGLTATPDPERGPRWAVHAAFADFDNDGLLDLFVVNYLVWDPATEPRCEVEGHREYCHPRLYKGLANQLFANKGDGTFRDVSQESGLRASVGKGMGAAVADYDQDGLLDVFVTNDKLFNSFFRNRGNLRFEERAFEAGVALAAHGNMISGMGVDFRDLDNDSYPDVILVALDNETFPLYRNTGRGDFEEITAAAGMAARTRPMAGYSPNIADFDNDGWKDIFVSRGHVQSLKMSRRLQVDQLNTVFRNLGNRTFEPLTETAGFGAAPPRRHRGAAVGDVNGDGRLDIVVSALASPAELWINESTAPNNWLALSLEGTVSNRDAVGARVKVVSKSLTQYEHVSSAAGYGSASAGPLRFGLGASETADLIEITWPSGRKQEMREVSAGRFLKVVEPRQP